MRVAWLFIPVVLILVAVALVRSEATELDVRETAARVEKLRGLRFEEVPTAIRVSQETASEGIRTMPPGERSMLELLGLVTTEEDLESDAGVWGAYWPDERRIEISDDERLSGPLFELTVAHELAHALEDQHFGWLDTEDMSDDAALAAEALSEGAAMLVERDYVGAHLGGRAPADGDWPDGWAYRDDRFIYDRGLDFVARLRSLGSGWLTVDQALKLQPPRSTEQVLHPEKWLADEWPKDVAIPRVRLGQGWKRVDVDVWGEWRTAALVGERVAVGWGGDRFELWRRGSEHVLVMRWVWDSVTGARVLGGALRGRPFARRPGARVTVEGTQVTLVIAPSDPLAARVS